MTRVPIFYSSMQLIANRQLAFTELGVIAAGQQFEIDDATGRQLLIAGTARVAGPPRVLYQTKVVVPEAPEVSARQPFRDGTVHHAEPTDVATEGNQLLPGTNVQSSRTFDSGGRGRRPRSGAE